MLSKAYSRLDIGHHGSNSYLNKGEYIVNENWKNSAENVRANAPSQSEHLWPQATSRKRKENTHIPSPPELPYHKQT